MSQHPPAYEDPPLHGRHGANRPVVALLTPVVPNDYRRIDVFRNLLTEMEGQRHGTGVEQVDAAAVDFS